MHPRILLPRGWLRHTKAAIIQILVLSHYTFTDKEYERQTIQSLLECPAVTPDPSRGSCQAEARAKLRSSPMLAVRGHPATTSKYAYFA